MQLYTAKLADLENSNEKFISSFFYLDVYGKNRGFVSFVSSCFRCLRKKIAGIYPAYKVR